MQGLIFEDRIHLIKNAGHLADMDNPDEFNELLLSFAKEVLDNL